MREFLDSNGISLLWTKIKERIACAIKKNVTNKLAQVNGIATLDENKKLPAEQLTDLKLINGESVIGKGEIFIDLGLYKVVKKLPDPRFEEIDKNKIYILQSPNAFNDNDYDEFIYINDKFERIGSYRAEVEWANYIKFTDEATHDKAGAMSPGDKALSDAIRTYGCINLIKDLEYYNDKIRFGFNRLKENDPASISSVSRWVDFNPVDSTNAGLMVPTMFDKVNNIDEEATKDSFIPLDELDAIFV